MNSQIQKIHTGKSFRVFAAINFALLMIAGIANVNGAVKADFDGDGKSDIAVYRRSDSTWHIAKSSGGFYSVQWGLPGDAAVPGDYDNDGKTDVAVYRNGALTLGVPTSSFFYVLRSSDNSFFAKQWGVTGGGFSSDSPLGNADFDGDRQSDFTVFTRQDYTPAPVRFKVLQSLDGVTTNPTWGFNSDRMVFADYDGDGKTDLAVFRPEGFSTPADQANVWFILNSSTGALRIVRFGLSSDRQVAADYDGDGKADIAVYRPSNGFWYRINSRDNSFTATQFGLSGDFPVSGDYDGDGRADIAVWRPETGFWYIQRSTGGFYAQQFGASSDFPL